MVLCAGDSGQRGWSFIQKQARPQGEFPAVFFIFIFFPSVDAFRCVDALYVFTSGCVYVFVCT